MNLGGGKGSIRHDYRNTDYKALQWGRWRGYGACDRHIAGNARKKAGEIVTGRYSVLLLRRQSRLGDFGVRKLLTPAADVPALASMQADEIVRKALADVGQTITDLPPNAIKSLREQVVESLKQGKQIDPPPCFACATSKR